VAKIDKKRRERERGIILERGERGLQNEREKEIGISNLLNFFFFLHFIKKEDNVLFSKDVAQCT
jgi:hypothetical protein